MRNILNLHAQIQADKHSADYNLLISATGPNGENIATIANINIDDPNLSIRLHDIAQAFRMGTRHGNEH